MKYRALIGWTILAALVIASCTPSPVRHCDYYPAGHRLSIYQDGHISFLEVSTSGRDSTGKEWEESMQWRLKDSAPIGSCSFSFEKIDSQVYTQLYQKVIRDSAEPYGKVIVDSTRRTFTFDDTMAYHITVDIIDSSEFNRIPYRKAYLELPSGWAKMDSIESGYRQEYK